MPRPPLPSAEEDIRGGIRPLSGAACSSRLPSIWDPQGEEEYLTRDL